MEEGRWRGAVEGAGGASGGGGGAGADEADSVLTVVLWCLLRRVSPVRSEVQTVCLNPGRGAMCGKA